MAISSSSSSSSSCNETKHVAVIPFPFGSHRITLSNLVFKLAHAAPNVVFSYIAPTHHTTEVFSKPNNIPQNLKRFDISDGVPEGHVLGNHNPLEEKAELFLKSCPHNLKHGVVELAVKSTKLRVTCILSDAVMTPCLTVAQELNVPWIAAWLCFSTALSPLFYTHIVHQQCAKHGMESDNLVDFLPGLSQMRISDLPYESRVLGEENETEFSRAVSSFGKALPQAKSIVMNFYEELDSPLFVQDMRSKLQSMLYVGFLTLSQHPSSSPLMDPSGCLEWLEKQRRRSVVYICFGTAMVPPPSEFVAIAEALETSGFPYLWTIKDELIGLLPDGFVERTRKRGKIVAWAPQMNVLGHESVGVYVTHGGMNSMMESVANGVPIICRPIFAEQSMCGRMASEVWGFGVKVEDGVFTKCGLMKSLNLILMEEEGNKVRENALKMKKTLRDVAKPDRKAAHDFKTLVDLICS